MLRLAVATQTPLEALLIIDGNITVDQLPLLTGEIRRCRQRSATLILMLDGVAHIDPEGLALLQQWCARGVALRGGTPFLRALLRGE
ncbi:MAG: hypothetical protein HOK67_19305 [Deltaproteobacteria bacterium]|jgi:ABC-type transporter Mla MlaB component|nr:hypothetical protein [Deltaproteobacteria bacterium]